MYVMYGFYIILFIFLIWMFIKKSVWGQKFAWEKIGKLA